MRCILQAKNTYIYIYRHYDRRLVKRVQEDGGFEKPSIVIGGQDSDVSTLPTCSNFNFKVAILFLAFFERCRVAHVKIVSGLYALFLLDNVVVSMPETSGGPTAINKV